MQEVTGSSPVFSTVIIDYHRGSVNFFIEKLRLKLRTFKGWAKVASAEKIEYNCRSCGQIHDNWPALAFDSPTCYNVLPESTKKEIGELTSDFCIIKHPEQIDRFIRGTLTIKVIDHCEDLEYGIWVSLSENSFKDYSTKYGNPTHDGNYFGWLSNDIAEYEISEEGIPTSVFTRKNGLRPEIVPHKDFDHQLIRDYYDGITKEQAEKRIQTMIKVVNKRNTDCTRLKRL